MGGQCGEKSCECECHGDQSCGCQSCGGQSCGQGACNCQACGGEEEQCVCKCHEQMCEDCARSGHKTKYLVLKAMKLMVLERIKGKLEKKYGKKVDAVADMALEAFEKHMKLKKEMMEQEEFDLRAKMMEAFRG